MPSTIDTIRRPWNHGRLIGPKPPLKPRHIWAKAVIQRHADEWLDLQVVSHCRSHLAELGIKKSTASLVSPLLLAIS